MAVRSDISALLEHVGVEGMAYYAFAPSAEAASPAEAAPPAKAAPAAETPPSPAPVIPFAAMRRQNGAFDLRAYGGRAIRAEMNPPRRLKLTVPTERPAPARPAPPKQAPPKPAPPAAAKPEAERLAIKPVAETPPEKESLQDLFARL